MCPQDVPMKCLGKYGVKQIDMDRSFVENTFAVSALSPGEDNVGDSTNISVALLGTAVAKIGEPSTRKL